MKVKKLDLLALAAGSALPFAFAPFYLSIVAFFSPALLLKIWLSSTPREAFKRGFLFGTSFFAVGISWVYISIHVFGQAPIPLALFITLFFVSYLALFIGVQGYCLNKFWPQNSIHKIVLVFPCSWIFFEMLRGWLFTGFPWLFLGYSQSNTPLQGFAPVLGVYGLSYIVAFISGLLVLLTEIKQFRSRCLSISLILMLLLAGQLLATINWTHPIGEAQKTTLIQGNIDQDIKWQPQQVIKTLDLYTQYSLQHLASNLIIWPEAAITLPLDQASDFVTKIAAIANEHRTTIVTGIPIVNSQEAYNGMIAIGNGKGVYHKRHLVPFGEYTPLKPLWGWVVQAFSIPMSNFQAGAKKQQPLTANHIFIAPYICYEIAYPLEFLAFLPRAQLLLTITDDSWFGHSIAAEQHLQMAQMRALETGRYLLFSSNTGITAVINNKGKIIKSIPEFQEAVLTTTVQPMAGVTPWMYWKMMPVFCLLFVVIALRILLPLIGRRENY